MIEKNRIEPANAFMIVDIISRVLAASDDIKNLSQWLTSEIREITGARLVLIVSRNVEANQYKILQINPERKKDICNSDEISFLINKSLQFKEISSLTFEIDDQIIKGYLQNLNFETNLVIPLIANNENYGSFLLLGLPDKNSLELLKSTYNNLTTILGLVFRNASLIDHQERIIQERTSELLQQKTTLIAQNIELESAKQLLEENEQRLQAQNEEYEALNEELSENLGKIQEFNEQLEKAKLKAEESEETYRMLFESINDAVFISELKDDGNLGKFIQVNDIACKRLGYTKEELLTMSPLDIGSEKSKQVTPHLLQIIVEKKHAIIEAEHVTKTGKIIPVEISTRVTRFKNKTIFHSVARDITERKQAEIDLIKAKEKAEESELKIQSIIDNFPSANICLLDKNLVIQIVGGTEYSKHGIDPRQFKNKHISELLSKSSYDINKPHIDNAFKGIYSNYEVDYKGFYYMNYACPLTFNSSEINYVLIATINFTELKKTELELILAKDKAEESDRLKTAFLQNMSHEIRTPMNAIMGFSELLLVNYNNKPKLEKFSQIINQRCNDLLEIINDILDIAKIESGQLPVNIEECDLKELFIEISTFFMEHQKRIGKQHINFNLNYQFNTTVNTILTDKVKLKQIFINLIGNAFKFTEKGQIEGGCKIDDNNNIVFYVSDTGIGIPSDKHDVIFERFAQLRQRSNQAYGGTGLGLPIVKGLVGLLGGKLWLESEIDKGATFYFSFPYTVSQQAHPDLKIVDETHEYQFAEKTVLIVEDDFYNAEFIKEILSETGLNIIHTEYGQEAIELAKSQSLDLILMDIRLPDMNGYEATKQIKLLRPNIRIIAQTAYASHDDKRKAVDAGCIDYISKPLKANLLLPMISKYLFQSKG